MMTKPKLHSALTLLPILALPVLGWVVGMATRPGVDGWYQSAEKASLNPPDWVFGVVWGVLYIMMGLAFSQILRLPTDQPRKKIMIRVFIIQLALNLAWSFIFFQMQLLWLASAWIIALGLCVLFFIVLSWRTCRPAAVLMIPYLGWITFACYLSTAVALLYP